MRLLNSMAPRPEKLIRRLRQLSASLQTAFTPALLSGALVLAVGCHPSDQPPKPSIVFTHIPPVGGGPEFLDRISGRVVNAGPGTRIFLYALSKDTWWIQPFRGHAPTEIAGDGSWENATHLGTDYAALLVAPGFQPTAKLSALPSTNGNVLAVAITKASSEALPDPKVIHFSGYDWRVRYSPNIRGGELCDYEPSNVWVDDRGYLHLLMGQEGSHWHCAGISLTRSLGYGTYRFVISDSANLPSSAVFTMFIQDQETAGAEMDIELSRWGKAQNRNADYVVQPYYIPENTVHFEIPAGPMIHVLRWEPSSVAFKSFAGDSVAPRAIVMDHVFKSGVPVPARERLHMAFYDFHHSQSGLQHPVEIVVKRFEYLP
ncbi:glycoside hydrolase family 16 protein [Granulicella sp. dw_53]|uniref:glycoside hydrolase family 16 protein n=1 Tax=Granulicella sp. dw_53 TaxID=2719792 RepID=UPI001C4A6240|nr:glycoside hydrolase family 16 protein [Granulicella sp. dw_53]